MLKQSFVCSLTIPFWWVFFYILVVSSTAAKSLTEERQIPTQIRYAAESSGRNQIAHVSQSVPHSKKSRPDLYETSSQNPVKSTGGSESLEPWQSSAVNSLCEKIQWASEELKHSNSVDYSIQLCQLIKGSADALQSLKSLQWLNYIVFMKLK